PPYEHIKVTSTPTYTPTTLSAPTTNENPTPTYKASATPAHSSVKNVQTLSCTPAAPNVQSATNVTSSSFTARWSIVSGATDYQLDVSTSNSFSTYVPGYENLSVGNVTSYPVTGLSASTTYYYRVRAYNGCATSPNSSVKRVKTSSG